jgi:hypothetical protein
LGRPLAKQLIPISFPAADAEHLEPVPRISQSAYQLSADLRTIRHTFVSAVVAQLLTLKISFKNLVPIFTT